MRDINDETTSPRADLSWYMGGIWLYFISAGIQGVIFPWIITIVLHESSARVGIAQMMMMLPMLIFTLFGGALADRMELRRHLMRLQLIQTIPPLALAALIHFGFLTYHLMLGFGVVLGILGAYVMPTRDAMLTRVLDSAYRRPLWNAAYLIEGGCGDDGFMDFRAGLALLGRDVFTRAVDDPDTLADVPTVVRMGLEDTGWIGAEGLHYAARNAYERVMGETGSFDASMESAVRSMRRPDRPAGEDWDVDDDAETRLRLPRLAALFL